MKKEEFVYAMRYTGPKTEGPLEFVIPGKRPAVFQSNPGYDGLVGFVSEQDGRALLKRCPGLFEFIDKPGGGSCDCAARLDALEARVEAIEKPKRERAKVA